MWEVAREGQKYVTGSEEERQVEEKAKVQCRKRETEFKDDRHERSRTQETQYRRNFMK